MSKSRKELKADKKMAKVSSSSALKVEKKKKEKREKKEKKEKKKMRKEAEKKERKMRKKLEKEREKEKKRQAKKEAKKLAKELKKKKSSKEKKGKIERSAAVLDVNGNEIQKESSQATLQLIDEKAKLAKTAPINAGQKATLSSPSIHSGKGATSITPVSAVPSVAVRKPVSIRTPGSNRPTLDINPVYMQSYQSTLHAATDANSFILRGINDSEESRILTRTFADKWYLPPSLYLVEAQTGLKYRRGRFSEEEKDLAKRLTLKFCKDQNMSLEQFKRVFFDEMGSREGTCVSNTGRLSSFFVDVAQHFGGRPVVAVYECLKRIYHPGNHRGPWTPEEDDILLKAYQKHGPKWTVIGKELNRLGINCRDRYNLKWKSLGQMSAGAWSVEEEKRLAEGITESVRDSGVISWIWISEERVKTRTPLQCISRFKSKSFVDRYSFHALAIARRPATSAAVAATAPKPKASWNDWKSDEDYLLIYAIVSTGLETENLINWRSLKVEGIPAPRHNHEIFFRRWNLLKKKAEVGAADISSLKEQVGKIKKYLIGKSKSPAYIFSDDEDEF